MAVEAVIFVGPSLPSASSPLEAVRICPPARRGDIELAAANGARIVGLIDGVFLQDRAVPPSEIVRAARQLQVRVYGAASLGALRAVECPADMLGIGRVFEKFRGGELRDDDEVAQTYDPETMQTIAFPLVRIREAVAAMKNRKLLDEAEEGSLLSAFQRLPFHERDSARIESISARTIGTGRSGELVLLLHSRATDIKGADAAMLIQRIKEDLLPK